DVGPDLIERLRSAAPDAAYVALHGRDGEDGTVQELLEILGIPYTGSGVLACIRSMDKVLTKHLLVQEGIPTPEFFAFNETAFKRLGAAETLPAIEERLRFPIVVKPASGGSALGIKFARTAGDVRGTLISAFSYDDKVLLAHHVRLSRRAPGERDRARPGAGTRRLSAAGPLRVRPRGPHDGERDRRPVR